MKKLFANPKARLALRALLVAGAVVEAKYLSGETAVRALIVGGQLAFLEVFTPLNFLVGYLKPKK